MEILNTLQQQKGRVLHCNPGPNCWCAQISFVFDSPTGTDNCLTPQEILNIAFDELTVGEQQYLESLTGRTFIK